nr:dihydrodipicolinate synthase family protein [Micromonospora sp. DSM 115978]
MRQKQTPFYYQKHQVRAGADTKPPVDPAPPSTEDTIVTAQDAKAWAREHLRGNCSSLYTPFTGRDGDDVDYDALRALVRHCLLDLDQDGLWLTGGIAESWALTTDEHKEVVRVAVTEARAVKP